MQDVVPPHVRQAVDEAWASHLEQACAGRAARAERTSAAETRVLVVRRTEGLIAATEGRRIVADGKVALIRAHLNNIGRYQRLLRTRVSDVERDYITARLSEERAALQHHSFNA